MDLDHVALATTDARAALSVLIGDWGAVELFGGLSFGFRPMQVRLGRAGMRLELLEPWETERNDFLARFLAKHGDGPHHITFKVKDLASDIDRLAGLGYELVGVFLDNPWWKEAFFRPKDAHGTVVQLSQSAHDDPNEVGDEVRDHLVRWWAPVPDRGAPVVTLRRVVVGSPDVDATTAFFTEILAGRVEARHEGRVDLVWPGGGRIGIVHRPGPGGIDHLECESSLPAADHILAGATFRW